MLRGTGITNKLHNRAVCILGMHRSGTSAIARAVNLLGVYLGEPGNLIPPDENINPKGYWEHRIINKIHENILNALSRTWNDIFPMPDEWLTLPQIQPYRRELLDLIEREFAGHPIWGWKEPRTCLFVPLWKEILAESNVDVSYVIVLRNPIDIAKSLQKRDSISLGESLILWLQYTLSALLHTRNDKKIIIFYDNLLQNWKDCLNRICESFDIPWPNDQSRLKDEMETFLDLSLRHSSSTLEEFENLELPNSITESYKLCLDAERNSDLLATQEYHEKIHKLYLDYKMYARLLGPDIKDSLTDKNKLIRLQDEKIKQKEWTIKTKDDQITQKNQIIRDKELIIQDKEQVISAILNTRSWKLTKPIRWIGKLIEKTKMLL